MSLLQHHKVAKCKKKSIRSTSNLETQEELMLQLKFKGHMEANICLPRRRLRFFAPLITLS